MRRVQNLSAHVCAASTEAAPPESEAGSESEAAPRLLSDAALADFMRDGFWAAKITVRGATMS
jgi:hypothetical protein